MSASANPPRPSVNREAKIRAALIAAYREGLELTAVAVVRGRDGILITVIRAGEAGLLEPGGEVAAQWWCRRAADADTVARAATARLTRHGSHDRVPVADAAAKPAASGNRSDELSLAERVIADVAEQRNITLHSDEEIATAALAAAALVDAKLEELQRAGELKSVNRSYRNYRTEASARGEKVQPYAEWLGKYRENMVRQLASVLRFN